jgi:Family of unknown function (DUF6252)
MQLIRPTQIVYARGVHSLRSRRVALVLTTSAFLSLAAGACGGDGPLAPHEGTGTLSASGAVSASGSGLALFQSISSGGTSLFQIVVVPVSLTVASTWQLQIANYSGRLAVGTYQLSPLSVGSPDPTANFYYTSAGTMTAFSSTSGQLVITSSSSSSVSGTFTFTATDVTGGTSSVTAHGSFNAQCAPGTTCQ